MSISQKINNNTTINIFTCSLYKPGKQHNLIIQIQIILITITFQIYLRELEPMASCKYCFLAIFVILCSSSIHVTVAGRNLLQTAAPTLPKPASTLPPLPPLPTLPQPTLPNLPINQPSLPKPTTQLPPLPSFPTVPTIPKITFPPLPKFPSGIPTTIPSIPFLSPPPSATSP